MNWLQLDQRPVVVAIAGPNGAGKSTFFQAFLAESGLPFINADLLAATLNVDPYAGAAAAEQLRDKCFAQNESFIFETVLSDPIGEKVELLAQAATRGYSVVLIYIRLAEPSQSIERVAMRVSRGGHDVPDEKLLSPNAAHVGELKVGDRKAPAGDSLRQQRFGHPLSGSRSGCVWRVCTTHRGPA